MGYSVESWTVWPWLTFVTFCSCDCVSQPCHSATGQKKWGNPKEREFAWSPYTSFQVSHFTFFFLNSSQWGHCELVETQAAGLQFQRIAAILGQVRPPAVWKVFQATTLSSVARCRPQSRLGWTLTPLTSPRWLCTMLAAAATTVVCLKCTTLDVQHRKPSFALSATFAARLAHLACAVDAVHSDVSTSRHAAKHRASSSAAWRDPHSHPMMKCLACWTYASSIASPDLDAAWGWVTWRPSKCHGSLKPQHRTSLENSQFNVLHGITTPLKRGGFWDHGNHKGLRDGLLSQAHAFVIASPPTKGWATALNLGRFDHDWHLSRFVLVIAFLSLVILQQGKRNEEIQRNVSLLDHPALRSKFHISHFFCLNSSQWGHCELVETQAAGLQFQRIAAILGQVRPPAVLKVFQATTLSSVARCRPQSRLGWTLTPLTSPRWLCTMLAAAATTVVCLKCTTLDVQHRKPSFALSATFAARLAHLACAVDAVHSDVSTSRHAAKHRASSSAAWRDPHSHPMMKCLACWTYASSIASPDLDAAWGWVTWRPSKCHGSLKPQHRTSLSNSQFNVLHGITTPLKRGGFWDHGNHKGLRDWLLSQAHAFVIASPLTKGWATALNLGRFDHDWHLSGIVLVIAFLSLVILQQGKRNEEIQRNVSLLDHPALRSKFHISHFFFVWTRVNGVTVSL